MYLVDQTTGGAHGSYWLPNIISGVDYYSFKCDSPNAHGQRHYLCANPTASKEESVPDRNQCICQCVLHIRILC